MDFLKNSITQGINDLISNIYNFHISVGEWLVDLGSNIGNFFSSLWNDYLKPAFQSMGENISNFNSSVGNWFSDLVTNIGNWFKNLGEHLSKLLSYINPFDENFFGYKIIDLFKELFNLLFVPTNNPFSEISNKFDEKFSFVNQIKTLINDLLGFNNYGDKVPSFSINYKGLTLVIIDFSIFLNYRTWLHGIILAISWFVFIRRTYNKIPSIIGGFSQ